MNKLLIFYLNIALGITNAASVVGTVALVSAIAYWFLNGKHF
jgi:hypothetical protein